MIGAGYTGRIVAEELARHARGDELEGILDDDPAKQGMELGGCRVVGTVGDLERLSQALAIDEVIAAVPSLRGAKLREINAVCRRLNLRMRTMPSIIELLGQPISPGQLRPVEVADLLRRAQVSCDAPPPAYLRGARVLITGAGGSIGGELAHQIARAEPDSLVLLGHGENSIHAVHTRLLLDGVRVPLHPVIADVTDPRALRRVFAAHRPTVVFHAAAHKHVPLMEAHVAEAVKNNVVGTRCVVRASIDAGVPRLIFISTDKAVDPSSVMGATKRAGEWIVRDAAMVTGLGYVTVRFGNVLGSRGSVVPVFERQIARGGPITLTHPAMRRFFMTIPEAVHLVVRAGDAGRAGDLFVLNMGEPVRIVDLARDMMALSGVDPDDMPITFTGLRPGEKLEEALWEPGSDLVPTEQADLLRVVEPSPTPRGAELDAAVHSLIRAAATRTDRAVHRVFATIMPSFRSSLEAERIPAVSASTI